MTSNVDIEIRGAVMALSLMRPEKKNALTIDMYAALAAALEQATVDPTVRVVTISGADTIFTAGNDLADFVKGQHRGPETPVFRFLRGIATFTKPLIAGVAGPAIGIGTTMLLHCDIVLATPEARFSLPFIDLGLIPEGASSLLLPRLIGRQRASLHLMLGEPFDAETAERYGLVARVVAGPELRAELAKLADRLAAKPPEALRYTKQLLATPDESPSDRIIREGWMMGDRLRSAEAQEAFAKFLARGRRDT